MKIKKFAALVLTLCLVVGLLPPVQTRAATEGPYTYEVFRNYTTYEDQAKIIGFDGSVTGDIVLPATLGGYPVTRIGESVFRDRTDITSVTVPEGVTIIDSWAFRGCTNLQRIDLPSSLEGMGYHVFWGCSSLLSIEIPEGVTEIAHSTFHGCTSLQSVTLPYGLERIWVGAFEGCTSLESIMIPSTVTHVESLAFDGCTSLQNVNFEDSITVLGGGAFQNCDSLEVIVLGGPLTILEDGMFKDCDNLKNVSLRSPPTEIEDYAFYNCKNLKYVDIPGTVEKIGYSAFYGSSLEEITFCGTAEQWEKVAEYINKETLESVRIQYHSWTRLEEDGTFSCGLCTATGHTHTFQEATCFTPKFCTGCGIITELANGHNSIMGPNCTTGDTCLICGTEFGQPLGHTWENDNCIICGEQFTLAPTNQSMVIGNSLQVSVWVEQHRIIGEGHYAKVTQQLEDGIREEIIYQEDWIEDNAVGIWKIPYAGVAAKEMTDEITVVVYDANGKQITKERTMTIESYALSQFNKTNNETLKRVLVDMLNYGAAAQKYFGYKVDTLANANLTAEHLKYATGEVVAEDHRQIGGNITASLSLENSLEMNFMVRGDTYANADYAIVTMINHYGEEVEIRYDTLEEKLYNGTTVGCVTVDVLAVADAKTLVHCKIYDVHGIKLTYCTYSIETYVARMSNAALADINDAIMKFGDSAYHYFHADDPQEAAIVAEPVSVTVARGEMALVTFDATGDGLTYEWYCQNAGETAFSKSSFSGNAYQVVMTDALAEQQVYCVVTDQYGNQLHTETVCLHMENEVRITDHPEHVIAAAGEQVNVTFQASGDGLTYEWYIKNAGDSDFQESTLSDSNTYSFEMSEACDGQWLYCRVTDQYENTVTTEVLSISLPDNTDAAPEEPEYPYVHDKLSWEKIQSFPIASDDMSIQELRQLCYDFFYFSKTFAWTPSEDYYYVRTTGEKANYIEQGTVYGGFPYLHKGSGNVYRTLDFYDTETGVIDISLVRENPRYFGNQCSQGSYWGWARVINSARFGSTYNMVPVNGFIPIGEYTFDESITDFRSGLTTKQICLDNGEQTMYEAYACLQLADGLVASNGGGHVVMVSVEPEVVRNDDGTINGEESCIRIIDQSQTWRNMDQSNGDNYKVTKYPNRKMSFAKLYKIYYIPFTFAEFLGTDPVEKLEYSFAHDQSSISAAQLLQTHISANYGMSDVYVHILDQSGNLVYSDAKRMEAPSITSTFLVDAIDEAALAPYAGGDYTVQIVVQFANGERHTVYTGTLQ